MIKKIKLESLPHMEKLKQTLETEPQPFDEFGFVVSDEQIVNTTLRAPPFLYAPVLKFPPLKRSCEVKVILRIHQKNCTIDSKILIDNNILPKGSTEWTADIKLFRKRRHVEGNVSIKLKDALLYLVITIDTIRFQSTCFRLHTNQKQTHDYKNIKKVSRISKKKPMQQQNKIQYVAENNNDQILTEIRKLEDMIKIAVDHKKTNFYGTFLIIYEDDDPISKQSIAEFFCRMLHIKVIFSSEISEDNVDEIDALYIMSKRFKKNIVDLLFSKKKPLLLYELKDIIKLNSSHENNLNDFGTEIDGGLFKTIENNQNRFYKIGDSIFVFNEYSDEIELVEVFF